MNIVCVLEDAADQKGDANMENLRILPSVEDAERDLGVDRENQSLSVDVDADDRESADTVARRPSVEAARKRLVAREGHVADVASTRWQMK